MLNQDTKRRIDAARNVLVGKVPDPKAQVEQITTALIYKFMDDMDKESEELGGEASFFVGAYAKYGWSKLLDPRIGGFERLNLYVEALLTMPQNPNLPQLFRNILKDSFLPYRDPETLSLFLKEINGFTYDHSEKLGDAFEYLLFVLGSQGDAGQFRTPRHIIDFIVEVLDPKKTETILDPACGTAGFLISGYKHILKQNSNGQVGSKLTPDEKTKLMSHFLGYDISPDMVRLSLTNLYLHGFPNPNIYEYDTLTSEERWDETYDVIMANPPFMSPKGGIRPHKRFSIPANRSEVLFVDYIAEHLNTHGRAGIIVPEGIIFQSGTAYKALRKMLVEKYLYAVVSLPAGIFQPYSGVKTSILLMDRQLAKKTGNILFVKVENDGFDLGAQRRAIQKNDLTKALLILQEYKQSLQGSSEPLESPILKENSKLALVVDKEKIAKSGDYNLSGERYREVINKLEQRWSLTNLEEVSSVKGEYGSGASKVAYNGQVRYIRITDIDDDGVLKEDEIVSPSITEEKYFLDKDDLLFARSGSVGRTYLHKKTDSGKYQFAGYLIRFRIDRNKALPDYVFYITKSDSYKNWIETIKKSGTISNINAREFSSFKFPLPPLDVQQEIIAELDSYQKVIDGARQVVENYKPTIKVDPKWKKVKLGQVTKVNPKKSEIREMSGETDVSFVPMSDLSQNSFYFEAAQTKKLSEVLGSYTYFAEKDVLLGRVTPCFENGKAGIARNLKNKIGFGSSEYIVLRPTPSILPQIIYIFITSLNFKDNGKLQMTGTGGLQRIPIDFVENWEIPLPPIETQKQIIIRIEEELNLIEANKKLIKIFEQKINDKIAEVWGEDISSSPDNTTVALYYTSRPQSLR